MQANITPDAINPGGSSDVTATGGTEPYIVTITPPGRKAGDHAPTQVFAPVGTPSGTVLTVTVTDSSSPPVVQQFPLNVQ